MRISPTAPVRSRRNAIFYRKRTLARPSTSFPSTAENLRLLIREAADQLCHVVDGDLDFKVRVSEADEDIDQLFSDEEEPPERTSDPSPASPTSLSELLREIREQPDTMGTTCLSDGRFIWPRGLAHYVDKHFVRLPEEFVHHALDQLRLRGLR